jgi:mutator protein MutT
LSRDATRPFVHVVAAAVIDAADRVLIAQRPVGKHMAGGWEFPGGKLEPGEERLAGLARELQEELGISIGLPRPLIRVRHAYPSREVLLDVWVVRRYSGVPQGLDGQALRWCTQDELATAAMLPADKPIVAALRLPERLTQISSPYYVVQDSRPKPYSSDPRDTVKDIRLRGTYCDDAEQAIAAAHAGTDFLVMRDALPASELSVLCRSVPVPVFACGDSVEDVWVAGATGINDIGAPHPLFSGRAH